VRIILIGQAAFAEKVLELLRNRGEEVIHVFAPPDTPGGRPDPLKAKALTCRFPLSQPNSFRSDAIYEQVMRLEADLIVMAFVTMIVPERVLYAPKRRSICFHPSLLPRHRGASAINWTLIQGDSEAGVSWFWPDAGIDTGPLLVQRRVPIEPDDTTGSLYFDKLFPLGIQTLAEGLDLITTSSPPRIEQDERLATYEPICRDEHARIDFQRAAREIHNLIRGCDPQPGAFAGIQGHQIRLYEPHLDSQSAPAPATPGTIIQLDGSGMCIALKDGTILVRRVRLDSNPKKVPPTELTGAIGLRVGQRLA
jgi:methionyl-tRNA formyltransferase